MRVEYTDDEFTVVLSRRNLLTLLAKLDGHPTGSGVQIGQYIHELAETVNVTAEEDAKHYGERKPGPIHPDTEGYIQSVGSVLYGDR